MSFVEPLGVTPGLFASSKISPFTDQMGAVLRLRSVGTRARRAARTRQLVALGVRAAQAGLLVNAVLAATKIVAGIVGHSYALLADGIESTTDVGTSVIVWMGLRISGRAADERFHFGYGKVESLAGAVVSLMLMVASIGIATQAIREIVTPHRLPAAFTLVVLASVVVIKLALRRQISRIGQKLDSTAVLSDASHHGGDAIISIAAFIGISAARLGGVAWAAADAYAALFAAVIMGAIGARTLRRAVIDLLDRAPNPELIAHMAAVARAIPGVRETEKVRVRKTGLGYHVEMHVQADPTLSLRDAHALGGTVKTKLLKEFQSVLDVTIHMEPFETSQRGFYHRPSRGS